jgi:hemerythrin superfamily protein
VVSKPTATSSATGTGTERHLRSSAGASKPEQRVRRGRGPTEGPRRHPARGVNVTIELVRHSVAEEVVVYPAVQDKVSAEEAQRAKVEHAEAEQTLKRLEGIDPNDPAFERELRELLREIREHLEEEEGEMFPRMRDILTQDELVELGTRVEAIKTMAPTRPHPSVPHDPAADPRGHSRSPQQVTWGTATRAMWEH